MEQNHIVEHYGSSKNTMKKIARWNTLEQKEHSRTPWNKKEHHGTLWDTSEHCGTTFFLPAVVFVHSFDESSRFCEFLMMCGYLKPYLRYITNICDL